MTWEIVVGIITFVGFIATVATWTSKLAKTLTVLNDAINSLKETVKEFKADSKEEHKAIMRRIDDHEERIRELERGKFVE